MHLSCAAENIITSLQKDEIIDARWASYFRAITKIKQDLVERTVIECKDEKAVEWLTARRSSLNYYQCIAFLEILSSGEEGADKRTVLLGGGFKSPLIKEWERVLRLYQQYRITVIEPALDLRWSLFEIQDLSATLVEQRASLYSLQSSIRAAERANTRDARRYQELEDKFNLTADELSKEDLDEHISTFLKFARAEWSQSLVTLLTHPSTTACVADYKAKTGVDLKESFGDMNPYSVPREVMDELWYYYRNDPGCEHLPHLTECRERVQELLKSEVNNELAQQARELVKLHTQSATKSDKVDHLDKLKTRLESSIVHNEDLLRSLNAGVVQLLSIVQRELESIFPHGVQISNPQAKLHITNAK